MATKILKRISEDARVTYMLLRELLVNCMGYTDVYSDPDGTVAFTADQSGVDGETDVTIPQTFVSASATFTIADINKYLVICDTTPLTRHNNVGIYKVIGRTDDHTITIQGGLYGGSFTTGINFIWRLVDPANVPISGAGKNLTYVVEAVYGTSPIWQAEFYLADGYTSRFRVAVGPTGGYVAPPTSWTRPITGYAYMDHDTVPLWTLLVSDSYIRMYTETTGGGSVRNLGYVGACMPRRSPQDQAFAVCFAGVPLTSLAAIKSIASDGSTQIDYSAIVYGDSVAPNMFTSLPSNQFDMRNDSALIPIGCEGAFPEDDRGIINGLSWISNLIAYKTFVDNSRRLLSLGNGIAIEWDGSLSR